VKSPPLPYPSARYCFIRRWVLLVSWSWSGTRNGEKIFFKSPKFILGEENWKKSILKLEIFTRKMLTNRFHVAVRLFSNRSQMTSSVIYYWTDPRHYSFYLIHLKKQKQNISKLLQRRPLPTLANTRKAIWRYMLSIQIEAISLLAMRSK